MIQAEDTSQNPWAQARVLLGVPDDANDEQMHQAYIDLVRKHPPDREPERFEQIRDAYQLLKDPLQRAMQALAVPGPADPLLNLLGNAPPKRRFIGPELWLNALKEKRS